MQYRIWVCSCYTRIVKRLDEFLCVVNVPTNNSNSLKCANQKGKWLFLLYPPKYQYLRRENYFIENGQQLKSIRTTLSKREENYSGEIKKKLFI